MIIQYSYDTIEDTNNLSSKIICIFKNKNISPNPVNYSVWYAYLKNNNKSLVNDMNTLLNSEKGYFDRKGRELFNKYLKEEVINTDSIIKKIIQALLDKVNLFNDKMDENTNKLEIHVDELKSTLKNENIKELTDNIMSCTSSIKNDSHSLYENTKSSIDNIETLKKELKEAKAQILTDELTEIGNRRAFNQTMLENMMDIELNNIDNIVFAIADIDHFKKFNDTYGHLVGDSVLRYFSKNIKKQLSEYGSGEIFRFGGEEFAIIFKNVDFKEIEDLLENIRKIIANIKLKIANKNKNIESITASFGLTKYKKEDTIDILIKRADDALYQSKENGRNQITKI